MAKSKEQLAAERLERNRNKFIEKLEAIYGGEYELLGEYVNGRTSTQFFHHAPHCNSEFTSSPEAMTQNRSRKGCPECMYVNRELSNEKNLDDLKKDLEEIANGEFTYISGFINYSNPCIFKHNTCGYELYEIKPKELFNNIKRSSGNHMCTGCANNVRYSIEDVKKRIKNKTNGEFEIISTSYKNNKSNLVIRHLKDGCNHTQKRLAHLLFNNDIKCELCDGIRSKGEIKIIKYLKENGIEYDSEVYKFNEKEQVRMFFDFYIPEFDLFIEYDGRHHVASSDAFFNRKTDSNVHDKYKNDWVAGTEHGLIRIPHTYDLDVFLNDLFVKEQFDPNLFTVNL